MTLVEKLTTLLTEPRTMDELSGITGHAKSYISETIFRMRKEMQIDKRITYQIRQSGKE